MPEGGESPQGVGVGAGRGALEVADPDWGQFPGCEGSERSQGMGRLEEAWIQRPMAQAGKGGWGGGGVSKDSQKPESQFRKARWQCYCREPRGPCFPEPPDSGSRLHDENRSSREPLGFAGFSSKN